jgi:hypothetical protein
MFFGLATQRRLKIFLD